MEPVKIAEARKMRSDGKSWVSICQYVGENYYAIRRVIDPEWAQSRRNGINQIRNRRRVPERNRHSCGFITEGRETRNPDYDPRRDGVIQPETLSQMFFGDPLPGRSALDRRVLKLAVSE
jgi:hypothetical protein